VEEADGNPSHPGLVQPSPGSTAGQQRLNNDHHLICLDDDIGLGLATGPWPSPHACLSPWPEPDTSSDLQGNASDHRDRIRHQFPAAPSDAPTLYMRMLGLLCGPNRKAGGPSMRMHVHMNVLTESGDAHGFGNRIGPCIIDSCTGLT